MIDTSHFKDKPHYYDGILYEMLIDPFFKEIRDSMSAQIKSGSSVIDIGCGTGSFVFELAEKCKLVVGVEISSKMFERAKSRQKKMIQRHIKNRQQTMNEQQTMSEQQIKGGQNIHEKQNICFIHGDSTNLSDFHNKQFDYVTISMALHEMPHDVREKVLLESKRIGKKIIIADYVSPQPFTFAGIRTRIVEFFAGIGHFTAFLNFQKNHGIHPLLTRFGLSVCHDFMIKNGTIRIVVVH